MSLLNSAVECPKCGCTGIHACIGKRLQPPTEKEIASLNAALDKIFPSRAKPK